jgi:chromosome segregation ATPase
MARAERHRQETDVVHGRYEAMQRAASVVMTDLGGAVERAHSLSGMIEEAERTIHRLGEQSRAAEGSAERLALTAEQTGVQERRLGELLASARAMHSEMEGTVANVDDKIGRLDSHHAAASTVLRNLGDTIKTAHELFKRAEDARNAIDAGVEQVAQRVDCLIRDVWSLTSRTETARDGLSTETGRAEDVLEKLTQTITPAESLIEAIRSASESAAGHADAINGQIVKAQEWTSRIDAFRAQLDELTARQATLAEAVRAAGSVHGELAADIGTAKDCAADLSAIAEDAGRLLESLSISRESARRDADRLAAQLHTVGAVLESAAPLLGDLHARAAEADRRMATVQENVSRLENRVEGALDAPRESIAAAQAQAAQLEKVVTAVRKVFASLSQATLDARTYAAQCDQSARHATQRLSELDAQTERSTRSLGQWIEEAVRAQQRLAAVLSSAPTIDQTHPMDAARAGTVGEVLSLSRETLGHELGTLPASRWARSAPGVEATSGEPCDEPAAAQGGGLPRSREIARLISDARQAVDSAEA